ncbi:MAG TPA: glucosamine-6-phosphate deaminase [Bacillota bacterium]|nr:glucosamine-6-phosphate deaminase [Bacillota bacterium]
MRTFNLDEFYPIEPDHPRSFHRFMWDHLFSQVNVRRDDVHLPRGNAADPAEECGRYEAAIEDAGGLDLLLLGIGANGHIGFNEPGTPLDSTTHLVCLTDETVAANARLFDRPEDVPRLAITMGPKTIMRARRLLLLAGGEAKATALAAALEGPVTPEVPASILQLHACATVIADRAAASRL